MLHLAILLGNSTWCMQTSIQAKQWFKPDRFMRISTLICISSLIATNMVGAATSDQIAPWVLRQSAKTSTVSVLIRLREQTQAKRFTSIKDSLQRRRQLVAALRHTAVRSQIGLIELLKRNSIPYRSYWIVNMIQAEIDAEMIQTLSKRTDVAYIHANPSTKAVMPELEWVDQAPNAVEANLLLLGADQLWDKGFTGQNIVIGGQDTGYQWDHPALINSYRGFNGVEVDHNYNWHDSIHSGSGVCGADSTTPCDDHNHGTHTMGIMVGDDGGGNQIGMAPGARWIGCRNMDQGQGTPASYAECFQWFVAPTDLNNQNPDPGRAPQVINNSWACTPAEGCTSFELMQSVVENVRMAGIAVVAAAGNSGSSCGSINTAAAIYDASFTVANTTLNDAIASSSSRGPVTVDGSNRMKPDISAPGSTIRSSVRNDAYAVFSGTSMSSPHVAGHLALLMSAQPSLIGDVDQLEQITRDSAVQLTSSQDCGFPGASPNNVFGFGRIDSIGAFGLLNPIFSSGFEQLPNR